MKILTVAWVIFAKEGDQYEISRNGGSVMISDIAEYIGRKEESFLYQGAIAMPDMIYGNIKVIGNKQFLPCERTKDNIKEWQDGLIRGLRACIKEEQFDFVFVHGGGEFCYNSLLECKETNQKNAFVLHINEDFISGEDRLIFKIPDLNIILVGNKIKEDLFRKCSWIKHNQVSVILNGVPMLSQHNKSKRVSAKRKRLVCIGSLQPRKNQIQLVRSFAIMPKEIRENIKLIICGKELKRYGVLEDIKNEISINDLQESVVYIGSRKREEMAAIYEDADGLVLPSLREGLSLVTLEMMQFGKPVIMFSDNETAYDVHDDRVAVLVDEHTDLALSNAIVRWYNAEWDEKYIRKYASYYSIERVADEYINYSRWSK